MANFHLKSESELSRAEKLRSASQVARLAIHHLAEARRVMSDHARDYSACIQAQAQTSEQMLRVCKSPIVSAQWRVGTTGDTAQKTAEDTFNEGTDAAAIAAWGIWRAYTEAAVVVKRLDKEARAAVDAVHALDLNELERRTFEEQCMRAQRRAPSAP